MKILLTGEPKAGKTVVLEKFRKLYTGKMAGIVGHALYDSEEKRVGFEAERLDGERRVYAHKSAIRSEFVVKNKYFVDNSVIDTFVVPEIARCKDEPETLILIDEIGRMQAFSAPFLATITELLESPASILATIVYDPEPWSLLYKTHPQSVLITVTKENRDDLPQMLEWVYSNDDTYRKLSPKLQHQVRERLKKYVERNSIMQVKKLFNNAILYIAEGRVLKDGDGYRVKGKTRDHVIGVENTQLVCDCDLFNGRNEYAGNAGECSHLQAIQLLH